MIYRSTAIIYLLTERFDRLLEEIEKIRDWKLKRSADISIQQAYTISMEKRWIKENDKTSFNYNFIWCHGLSKLVYPEMLYGTTYFQCTL